MEQKDKWTVLGLCVVTQVSQIELRLCLNRSILLEKLYAQNRDSV